MSAPVDPPDYTPLGQRLQERTEQIQPLAVDALYGWAHGHLSEAMMRGLAQAAELIDPVDPYVPWEPLFNVDICPAWALPWLAQCVGVVLPQTVTEDEARELIKGLGIQKRGTVDAIRAAGDVLLTGDKTVFFRERHLGDPYALEIIIDESSLPESDRPLKNWVGNPRPKLTSTAGWTVASKDPEITVDPLVTVQVFPALGESPGMPPSSQAIKIKGTTTAANKSLVIDSGPTAGYVVFDPLPIVNNYVLGQAWTRIASNAQVYLGVMFWKADGTIIVHGGNIANVGTAWQRQQVSRKIPKHSDYNADAAGYSLSWRITIPAVGPFECYIGAAMAFERETQWNAAIDTAYGDPMIKPGPLPGGWNWVGADGASPSVRIPTTRAMDAYKTQIPAGIVYLSRTVVGWDYEAMTFEGGTYAEQSAAYTTYTDLQYPN